MLKASIERLLREEESKRGWTAGERLNWLMRQLDEYIERLTGFCAFPHLAMSALTRSDLFWTIEAASDVADAQLRTVGVSANVVQRWAVFMETLNNVRSSGDKASAEQLRAALSHVREAM